MMNVKVILAEVRYRLMRGIATQHLKTLCIIIAVSVLLPGTIRAEDCPKAREIYSTGAKVVNYQERAIAFQKAVDLCPSFADAFENLAKAAKDDAKKFNKLLAAAKYQEAIKRNNRFFSSVPRTR
jgi:hypothetical protein